MSTDAGSAGYWQLVSELATLRERRLGRQPSDRTLAAIAGVSPTTIGAWLRGARFPQGTDQLFLVIRSIRAEAHRLGLAGANLVPSLDEDAWRRAYRSEATRRAAAVGAAVSGAQATETLSRETRTVRSVDPLNLGVHEARTPDAKPWVRSTNLTPYFVRTHDRWLAELLGPTAQGGPSVLAVLTGESTVGKTRAMYEAVLALVPHWPLHAPADAKELVDLLEAGEIVAGSVLWLNEAQRHLAGPDGEAAALRLDRLLTATTGIVAVSSMWRRPYWEQLTEAGQLSDLHAAARTLLRGPRTVMIPVPDRLTDAERDALPSGDGRITRAVAAGANDGRVIQQLTGGPELVRAYHDGGLFTPQEHALLTAALDARRLGYQQPLPAALLAAATEGYLTPWNRPANASWCAETLASLTTGTRPDGSRADIRRGLKALTAIRTRSGTEPGYLPADYLDQEARVSRQYELGPAELWEALVAYTDDPDQLTWLGYSAHARGLHHTAARLWWRAANLGEARAALELLDTICTADPDALEDAVRQVLDLTGLAFEHWHLSRLDQIGARDQAAQLTVRLARDAPLVAPGRVVDLLHELRRYGQSTETLLAREPARSVDLSAPGSEIAAFLKCLEQIGATSEIDTLLSRAPERTVDLRDVDSAKSLAQVLTDQGASAASTVVLRRAAAEIDPGNLAHSGHSLYRLLRHGGGDELLAATCSRLPDWVRRSPPCAARHLTALLEAGARQLATQFGDAIAAEVDTDTDVSDTTKIVELLWDAGLTDATAALASRLAHTDLSQWKLARIARTLHRLNLRTEAELLATRISATTEPETEWAVNELFNLRGLSSFDPVATAVAAHMPLTDPGTVTRILAELRRAKADHAVDLLLERDLGQQVALDGPAGPLNDLIGQLAELNRQADIDLMLRRGLVTRIDLEASQSWDLKNLLARLADLRAKAAVTSLAKRLAENLDARDTDRATLVRGLVAVGATGAAVMLARRLADQATLTFPQTVVDLLAALRTTGDVETAAVVATRCVAEIDLGMRYDLGMLVEALRDLPNDDAVLALADRIARKVDVEVQKMGNGIAIADIERWHNAVNHLLATFDAIGATAAVSTLWHRLVDSGNRHDLWSQYATATDPALAAQLVRYGRKVDGTTQPWSWAEICDPNRVDASR